MDDPQAFLDAARAILGERGLTRDPDLVEPWLTDWRGRFTGRALALASPASTAEVAALVELCAEHRVGIVPQGGNSGMSGGATPDASGAQLLLSLRRMNAIRAIDAPGRQAVCEAGVILETLHHAAEAQGLRFPLSLGGKGSATVGGLFVMITLSVIIQVGSFKLTGRRVFRMAPLQHHFELAGWGEVTIVIRFWIIAGLFVGLGLGVFYAEWVVGS